MSLEVGMYVRGKYYQYRGRIGKIIKNYNNELEIAYKDGVLKTSTSSFIDDNFDIKGKQYNASYSIIDLIEVGDYVNGKRVVFIDEDYKVAVDENDITTRDFEGRYEFLRIKKEDIKSIVTKEKFENISYKVEEENV